ncbi:DUF5000 domain-containing lipoprotein [Pedobacter nyackensis]|uniref:DUF5000 domain-containing lipoprotein n=1 Tax=Pedobacter nyackensis TaxID=475255 RepID=UPI00292D1EFB|nr:DUF5000 domain-containing lipoprotein [Pedobacter nyackensis]
MKVIEYNTKSNFIGYTIFLVLGSLLLFTISCKENQDFNDIVSLDKTKPDPVTSIKVSNYAGGSVITYSLPTTKNLLYILAEYKINDQIIRQSKSSYYTDTIRVEGFAKSQEYDVTLYAVSRADIKSDPVVVKVHPETPSYLAAFPTLVMQRDFGGVNIAARNPQKKAIGVIVISTDKTTGKLLPVEQFYTEMENINFSVRGFDTLKRDFGVYITDRWGNISDTLLKKISPIYEVLVPKDKFSEYRLASDSPLGATSLGWNTTRLWDGITADPGWHTAAGQGKPLQVCTFSMGTLVKLSRYKIWERGEAYGADYSYNHGNARSWTLWGSNSDAPQDVILPVTSNYGDVVGDWVNLGNFECPPPPSGNKVGQTTPADLAAVKAGFEFNIPLNAPRVKYIRLAVNKTWGATDFAHVMELSFYGNTQ